ncbi:MerR family transcriptional regulator [Synechocystis sp. PCC 6714]|uniref:MerR family transcriptional regulator n=1 Tax=Synechocystis sp. (strain PCC 6714) TaxID=1147 RepID=UPI0004068FDB|nr:MerR family transcriptional regulator [Synechocystis sp. PCC 6714]AIE76145.1 hypothetical protein D082_40990 [Synechocystis sp. PCC 6714]
MSTLQQFSQAPKPWSLDEFVEIVNGLLPQFLPEEKSHTRVREEMTSRLVRHYTGMGLLDEPLKEGREARYLYRHLLQALLVRRLLVEGYGASAIDNLAKSKTNQELEALLQGGVVLTLTPANPALNFLQEIQQRSAKSAPAPSQSRKVGKADDSNLEKTALPTPSIWTRLVILPGLEVHVRNDFLLPSTHQEQQNLWQRILQSLSSIKKKRFNQ